ncbi:MAG TPA: hypothetical protein VK277_16320 [Acidimicrobiales bacterium]|nr:hypothetical protein [Acidimicrobiales bacterium]
MAEFFGGDKGEARDPARRAVGRAAETRTRTRRLSPERRQAEVAIRRHRVYLVLLAAALVGLLLFVPTLSNGRSSPGAPVDVVVPAGVTPPTPAYGAGVATSGVTCGPGVRQVAWSAYAPPCQPAWHGKNGGATSRGVTATTIRIAYREAASSQLSALYSLVPPDVVGTNQEAISTLRTYIDTFNRTFELYGRKVVLVPYDGKGDFVNEDLGQDQQQAQEDAVYVATSLKAFADTSLIDSSSVYTTDLAAQNVVALSVYVNDAAFYQQFAPWEYTPGPNCSKSALATGAVLGRQLAGLPAVDAGDPVLRHHTRVYGIIYPEGPTASSCAEDVANELASYGQAPKVMVALQFNLGQFVDEAQNAVAQLKAAGVTTVVCASCDPITPIFVMQAADRQDYHPEWWYQSTFASGQTNTDAFTRLLPRDQVSHMISTGNQAPPYAEQEAYTAYRLGNPSPRQTILPTYSFAYLSLLQLFTTLQLAGPYLTPANFEAASRLVPVSARWGMYGAWDGKAGPYDPPAAYRVVQWQPDVRSASDGRLGTWVDCEGGRQIPYARAADVPAHRQLTCSAKAGAASTPPGSAAVAESRSH